jgi:hypothetical protein
MAEKYIDSLPHLAALYYITTSGPDDAAAIAGRDGTKKSWWLTSVVKPMREELADLLGIFRRQPVQWKDKFLAGDEIPLWRLVDQYEAKGNERMAATLKSLAAHESCKALVERLGSTQDHHPHAAAKRTHRAEGSSTAAPHDRSSRSCFKLWIWLVSDHQPYIFFSSA